MKIDSVSNSSLYGPAYGVQATTGKTGANNTLSSGSTSKPASTNSAATLPDYYYDKKDLNKDGIVTLEEEILYALTHGEQLPGEAAAQAAAARTTPANYNQQGSVNQVTEKTQSTIDIVV